MNNALPPLSIIKHPLEDRLGFLPIRRTDDEPHLTIYRQQWLFYRYLFPEKKNQKKTGSFGFQFQFVNRMDKDRIGSDRTDSGNSPLTRAMYSFLT